jgi:hypothetical protein
VARSFLKDLKPSAIVTDGLIPVPLFAVTAMTLSQTYHLPPVGSSGARALVGTHDDTISLSGLLVGDDRFTWKLALETMAESGARGGSLAVSALAAAGLNIAGLILITAMTIRTDMQMQSLSFSASAARRDVLEVAMTLVYVPAPGALGKLLDLASLGVSALAGW